MEPTKTHTVAISTQHAEPLKATRMKEVTEDTGPEETAPSMKELNALIKEKVTKTTLEEIILKSKQPALTPYGKHTHICIQPSGESIIGGLRDDAGSSAGRSSSTPSKAGALTAARPTVARTPRR